MRKIKNIKKYHSNIEVFIDNGDNELERHNITVEDVRAVVESDENENKKEVLKKYINELAEEYKVDCNELDNAIFNILYDAI